MTGARRGSYGDRRRRSRARSGTGARRGGPHLLGRRRAATSSWPSWRSEAAKPKASPTGPCRASGVRWSSRARSWRSCTRCRCRRCGASGRRRWRSSSGSGIATVGDLAACRGRRWSPPSATPTVATCTSSPTASTIGGRARPAAEVDRPRGDLRPRPFTAARDAAPRGRAHGRRRRRPAARRHGWPVGPSSIKVRFHDFRTITAGDSRPGPVDTARPSPGAAKELLDQSIPSTGVRLLGVCGPTWSTTRQLSLDYAADGRPLGRRHRGPRRHQGPVRLGGDRPRERLGAVGRAARRATRRGAVGTDQQPRRRPDPATDR